ncbi:hypothetical protein OF83DRAFT_1134836, partial [Amylostereum chailletii]
MKRRGSCTEMARVAFDRVSSSPRRNENTSTARTNPRAYSTECVPVPMPVMPRGSRVITHEATTQVSHTRVSQ